VDTEATRQAYAKYLAETTFLDGQLGACMDIVDRSGRADDTIVIFTSEQGSSFPFGAKWTCYDNGLKTCFVVRWPGRVKAGSTTDAMVQYVDVVPTLIEAAGGDPTKVDVGLPGDPNGGSGFDGRSFLDVLDGKTDHCRDYVFGQHTTLGIINGTPCYPIRSVRSRTHKYIINPSHEATFTNAATKGAVWESWVERARTDSHAAERVRSYQHRPAEELYDLTKDPYEMKNVADDPKLANVKADLRKQLLAWMKQQGDEGNATERKARERQARPGGGNKKPRKPAKK